MKAVACVAVEGCVVRVSMLAVKCSERRLFRRANEWQSSADKSAVCVEQGQNERIPLKGDEGS